MFGDKIAAEVTADDVTEVLNTIEERGALVHADRAKAAIGSTFKWARQRWPGKYPTNPTMGLGKRAPAGERRRILSHDEITLLWSALDGTEAPLSFRMRLIFKLALLTGKRRSEVGGARVQELKLAGNAPTWTIPGDSKLRGKVVKGRSKNAEDQVVQLSRQAADLFRMAIEYSEGSDYAFPADASRGVADQELRAQHIHGESISMAMRRLRAHCGIEDVTTHDLRRTCATWLGLAWQSRGSPCRYRNCPWACWRRCHAPALQSRANGRSGPRSHAAVGRLCRAADARRNEPLS